MSDLETRYGPYLSRKTERIDRADGIIALLKDEQKEAPVYTTDNLTCIVDHQIEIYAALQEGFLVFKEWLSAIKDLIEKIKIDYAMYASVDTSTRDVTSPKDLQFLKKYYFNIGKSINGYKQDIESLEAWYVQFKRRINSLSKKWHDLSYLENHQKEISDWVRIYEKNFAEAKLLLINMGNIRTEIRRQIRLMWK